MKFQLGVIVHNFTQMLQIFTVLSLLHTRISLLGKLHNENIRSNLIPCIFSSYSEVQCHWEQNSLACWRNTGYTFIFSLAETKHKASRTSAVADNLWINPRVKHLKPYLKYTSLHLCLDSLRHSLRKDKRICPGFYYTVLVEPVPNSDLSAIHKKEKKKKFTRMNCWSSHFPWKTIQEFHPLY